MAEDAMGRSSNFYRSKFKVKMNFKTVRTRLLPILKYIEAGNYPAKIARMLGLTKPHVAYYFKKLEKRSDDPLSSSNSMLGKVTEECKSRLRDLHSTDSIEILPQIPFFLGVSLAHEL